MKRSACYVIRLVLISSTYVFSINSYATPKPQNKTVQEVDTAYINGLNKTALDYRNSDLDSSNALAQEALKLSESINYPMGKADALVLVAFYKSSTTDAYAAMGDFNKSMAIYHQLLTKAGNDTVLNLKTGFVYNLIGIAYLRQSNFPEALKNLLTALKIRETYGDVKGVSYTQNNLGILHYKQSNYPESLKFYFPSLKIREQLSDTIGMAISNNNIATAYQGLKQYDKALSYFDVCMKLHAKIGDSSGINLALMNIGLIYKEKGMYDKALDYYNKSLPGLEDLENKTDANGNIAEIYFLLGNQKLAGEFAHKTLELALQTGNYDAIQSSYATLSDIDSANGNYKSALEHYKKAVIYNDSIFNEANTKKLVQTQMQYDFDKQVTATKAEQEKKDFRQRIIRNSIIVALAGTLVFLAVVYIQRNKIAKARKRSDELLLNILPEETAEELKATGTAIAKDFTQVTVMFTDFKNFTSISEKLTAQELVNEINYCYSAFDLITAKHKIEKIKTIGDSYMCAGGLPVANNTNAVDTLNAALEIRDFMLAEKQKRDAAGKPFFEIRIGCHTGTVVAGIVGIRKFAYDIWGDTVNIASRMESAGEPGKVNISGATYQLVTTIFNCSYRGQIPVKNKGDIAMYFVEG